MHYTLTGDSTSTIKGSHQLSPRLLGMVQDSVGRFTLYGRKNAMGIYQNLWRMVGLGVPA